MLDVRRHIFNAMGVGKHYIYQDKEGIEHDEINEQTMRELIMQHSKKSPEHGTPLEEF